MAYKARFQPLEAYSTDGWLPFALPAEETPPKT